MNFIEKAEKTIFSFMRFFFFSYFNVIMDKRIFVDKNRYNYLKNYCFVARDEK